MLFGKDRGRMDSINSKSKSNKTPIKARISSFKVDNVFTELKPDEKLKTGDVLLMSILNPSLNHVAIYLGDDVLHHLTDRLSCKEPYSSWLLKCTGKRYRYVA